MDANGGSVYGGKPQARQYHFDDCERSILIQFSRQPATTGLKSLPHAEISATGFSSQAIEAAYRSLRDKGLTHANSKDLVLEPKGTNVADGVYLLMLRERYSDAELPASDGNDEPKERIILSPFEKAIFPWFASLTNRWQPAPEEMTDAEEKAMYRLVVDSSKLLGSKWC